MEVGNGVAEDYNDYQIKGEINGNNTAVASAKVVTGQQQDMLQERVQRGLLVL
ncbi:hypothetical protein ODZ84_15415 [Chryseobacterium fluminis]|uniref:hypothetical protein n=1 Tax=Chryseobacterium fluminis TaxID=2983606 RepID=UPI00224CF802|nr:hypothetical protein [Chryseobacterium sp. MMS21-Ot14]UZT96604.1 hypothetical protein ODZ84_15415 [Chryseobacterium sp. MMS21-Ot14]